MSRDIDFSTHQSASVDLERVFAAQAEDARRRFEARQRADEWPHQIEQVLFALAGRVQALEAQLAGQGKA